MWYKEGLIMNSDISNTQNALGTVAQWIAQDGGVKIQWHNGGEVYADMNTKTLHIPSIAEADSISGDDLWLCRAHVYHEAGHIIETGKQKEADNAGLHTVFNALEDRRMERILRKRYAGAEIAFKKSLAHYNGEIANRMAKKHTMPQFEALLGLSFEVEGMTPAWQYADEAAEVADLIRGDFKQVFSCKSARECLQLAKIIWDKIKSDDEDRQEQQQDQSSDGQSSDGQQGEGQQGEGQQGEGQSDGQGDEDGKSQSRSPMIVKDLGDDMAAAAQAFGRDAIEGAAVKKILDDKNLEGNEPYTCDRTRDHHLKISTNAAGREEYKAELAESTGATALLARTLEEYLKAVTKSKMLHCQRRGKLDPRRFTVLAKGLGKDVFKRMSNHAELDTAIEIIFDESGSMWEYKTVRKAIMIMAEALNRVGIPFEVTGGTTSGDSKYGTGLLRTNPILFRHYKAFNENWESVRGSIAQSGAWNNYIDGEMVEYAARRLVERPEKRKIIFSLSDGCPCGGEGHDNALGRKLISECEKCRNSGIEVYSFGIRTDEPSRYYGKKFSIVLEDDIGGGLAKGISSVMTKGSIA